MPVEIDRKQDFSVAAGLTSATIGAARTINGFGGNHVFHRTAKKIREGDPDTLLLAFPTVGSPLIEQDDRQTMVANGEMVFFDSSRPFQVAMQEPFRWQLLAVPKSVLRIPDIQSQKITAISIPRSSGIGSVVRTVLKDMISHSTALSNDAEATAVGGHAADLIATLIRSVFGETLVVNDGAAVLRETVLAFLRRRHGDRLLTATMIAAAHHVSLRTLFSAFEGSGDSLMDTLRGIRTSAARDDLGNPRYKQWNVSHIAAAHGFASPSNFARAFRETYNMTPSEYRRINTAPSTSGYKFGNPELGETFGNPQNLNYPPSLNLLDS
ncbi:MAG: helix-turn-helix domain-containing protein [Kineosporiaceae bacterium]|nr:helix-turn-helix domain-containing protein [Aeromicrobium sp.]